MEMKLLTVTLAAGLGTRMKSDKPKVLHPVGGRSMLAHVLDLSQQLGSSKNAVVLGPELEGQTHTIIPAGFSAETYIQYERLGTAHAVLAAKDAIVAHDGLVLVLYGDTPLMTETALTRLIETLNAGADVCVLGFITSNPAGYGRLIVGEEGDLLAVREDKEASTEEKNITLCNSGVFGFRSDGLLALLESIGNANTKQEYYLTDSIEKAREKGLSTKYVTCPEEEVSGVNSRAQLAAAEAVFQKRKRLEAMENGATLIDPDSVYFSYDTRIGRDVLIEPHVFFGPGVSVGDKVHVKAFCHLEGTTLAPGAAVGPYARLRPGAEIGEKAKVGNFVEIKKAKVEEGAKVSHLTYIGDARIGKNANIGAGTITCNYDGFRKHFTDIGEGAFIGSNSALVAPVKIGDGAFVGSGSVITRNVAPDALAVARGRQEQREDWANKFRALNARLNERGK